MGNQGVQGHERGGQTWAMNMARYRRIVPMDGGVREEAGTYTVRWDGRDDDGRELASGVYLYRLRTGEGKQVKTRKLVLAR